MPTRCLALLPLILLTMPTYAQRDNQVWVGAGAGPGTLFDGDGESDVGGSLGAALYASYQSGGHVFSLRTVTAGEFVFGDNFLDVGLLYGRATTSPGTHASVSLGLVVGERRWDGFLILCSTEDGVELAGDVERIVTVGLASEAQSFWRPTSFGGVGLYGFANLNPDASFAGIAVGFQFGTLR